MKTAVCGYSGSGKSTLASWIGKQEACPVLFLDKVQFTEGWKERDRAEARDIVKEFMQQNSWVIDGNYGAFFFWERMELADQILILEFNRFSCLYRAVRRFLRYRNKTRESMAEGCREKLDLEFVFWILKNGRTLDHRNRYTQIKEKYPGKTIVIRNQRELNQFYRNQMNKK